MQKVFNKFDTRRYGAALKDDITNGMNCLGLKASDLTEFIMGLDVNQDGKMSQTKNLPDYIFKAATETEMTKH